MYEICIPDNSKYLLNLYVKLYNNIDDNILIDFYLVDDLNENFDELSNQNKGNFNFTH